MLCVESCMFAGPILHVHNVARLTHVGVEAAEAPATVAPVRTTVPSTSIVKRDRVRR